MSLQIFEPDMLERSHGSWQKQHLQRIVHALKQDGVILIRNVAPLEEVDALNERMLADIDEAKKRNRNPARWQGVRPPPHAPYLFHGLVHNEWAIQITHRMLGDGVSNIAYASNTAYPGCGQQDVHADESHLWPGLAHPTASLVVNIPLVDVSEQNGATQIWPGTHMHTDCENHGRPTEADVKHWEQNHPSTRMCSQRGDIVIRDMRTWHCGMPNMSTQPRPMLAMVHVAKFMHGGFQGEAGSEDFWSSHPVLGHRIECLPAPVDYLFPKHSKVTWFDSLGGAA